MFHLLYAGGKSRFEQPEEIVLNEPAYKEQPEELIMDEPVYTKKNVSHKPVYLEEHYNDKVGDEEDKPTKVSVIKPFTSRDREMFKSIIKSMRKTDIEKSLYKTAVQKSPIPVNKIPNLSSKKGKAVAFKTQEEMAKDMENTANDFIETTQNDTLEEKTMKIIDLLHVSQDPTENTQLQEERLYCLLYLSFLEDGSSHKDALELIKTIKKSRDSKKPMDWSNVIYKYSFITWKTLLYIATASFLISYGALYGLSAYRKFTAYVYSYTKPWNLWLHQVYNEEHVTLEKGTEWYSSAVMLLGTVGKWATSDVWVNILQHAMIPLYHLFRLTGVSTVFFQDVLMATATYTYTLFTYSLGAGAIMTIILFMMKIGETSENDDPCKNIDQASLIDIKNMLK